MTGSMAVIHGEAVQLLAALSMQSWSEVVLRAALVAGVATFGVAGWRLLGAADSEPPPARKPGKERA